MLTFFGFVFGQPSFSLDFRQNSRKPHVPLAVINREPLNDIVPEPNGFLAVLKYIVDTGRKQVVGDSTQGKGSLTGLPDAKQQGAAVFYFVRSDQLVTRIFWPKL